MDNTMKRFKNNRPYLLSVLIYLGLFSGTITAQTQLRVINEKINTLVTTYFKSPMYSEMYAFYSEETGLIVTGRGHFTATNPGEEEASEVYIEDYINEVVFMGQTTKIEEINMQRPLAIILQVDNGQQIRMIKMDLIPFLGTEEIPDKVTDNYFMINEVIPKHALEYPKWDEIKKAIQQGEDKAKADGIEILGSGFAPTIGVVFVLKLNYSLPEETYVAFDEFINQQLTPLSRESIGLIYYYISEDNNNAIAFKRINGPTQFLYFNE